MHIRKNDAQYLKPSGEELLHLKDEKALEEIRRFMRWRMWVIKIKTRLRHRIDPIPLPPSTNYMTDSTLERVVTTFFDEQGLPLRCDTYHPSAHSGSNYPRLLLLRRA